MKEIIAALSIVGIACLVGSSSASGTVSGCQNSAGCSGRRLSSRRAPCMSGAPRAVKRARTRSSGTSCGRCGSSSVGRHRPLSSLRSAGVRSPRPASPSCSPAPATKPEWALRYIPTCFGTPAATPWPIRAWIRERSRPIWAIGRSIRRRGMLRLPLAGSKTSGAGRKAAGRSGAFGHRES
jgi:hypothetical protein